MRLDELKLSNFRCFEKLSISFHPNLTVLVGVNGSGKTALLDAITYILSPLIKGLDQGKYLVFVKNDVMQKRTNDYSWIMEAQYPVSLEAHGHIPEIRSELNWYCERLGDKSGTTFSAERLLQDYATPLLKSVRQHEQVTLPIIAYYGAGRLWKQKKLQTPKAEKTNAEKEILSRMAVYQDCFDAVADYKAFAEWFRDVTIAHIATFYENWENVQRGKEIEELDSDWQPHLYCIRKAVDICLKVAEWEKIKYHPGRKEITIQHLHHGQLSLRQMSDGIKSMVAMVADIAYRIVFSNPHLGKEAIAQTPGIVLIDEVDMHLHPKWQQTVLEDLKTAFPKIQFIVTTHSPQVLTTVEPECIRILDWQNNKLTVCQPRSSYGAESSRLLKDILGVSPRPNNEMSQKLSQYFDLIDQGKGDSSEAIRLKERLEQWSQGDEPALIKAEMEIRRRLRRRNHP